MLLVVHKTIIKNNVILSFSKSAKEYILKSVIEFLPLKYKYLLLNDKSVPMYQSLVSYFKFSYILLVNIKIVY